MKWSLCLLKVLLLVLTCLPNAESKKRNPSCPLKTPFKTLTYNAILSDNAWLSKGLTIDNNSEDRRDALIDYLKTTDACVVCLQEVYLGPDVQAIVDGLSDKFPYAQSQLHLFNGVLPPQTGVIREPVCDDIAVTALLGCPSLAACLAAEDLAASLQCLLTNCNSEVMAVFTSTKCIVCILNGLPGPLQVCTSAVGALDINPMGLVLLSKRPMSDRLIVPHYPGVVQIAMRGYIQAKIDEKILIACSHQTTTDSVSFEPLLSQYLATADAQNDYEIDDLISRLGKEKALVLLGDMNVGPSCTGVVPVKEERYKRLAKAFNTDRVKECTYCKNNPYNVLDSTDVDVNIDHVFTSKCLEVTNAKVVLKTDDASVDVGGATYPLSDHYGVEARITCSDHKTSKHSRSSKHGHRRQRRYA